VMGLGLSAEGVAALEERTEGWIAGFQLAALSMRDRRTGLGCRPRLLDARSYGLPR
jgi:ATP/maltotriose-dependent transcriptional regulator MalT